MKTHPSMKTQKTGAGEGAAPVRRGKLTKPLRPDQERGNQSGNLLYAIICKPPSAAFWNATSRGGSRRSGEGAAARGTRLARSVSHATKNRTGY